MPASKKLQELLGEIKQCSDKLVKMTITEDELKRELFSLIREAIECSGSKGKQEEQSDNLPLFREILSSFTHLYFVDRGGYLSGDGLIYLEKILNIPGLINYCDSTHTTPVIIEIFRNISVEKLCYLGSDYGMQKLFIGIILGLVGRIDWAIADSQGETPLLALFRNKLFLTCSGTSNFFAELYAAIIIAIVGRTDNKTINRKNKGGDCPLLVAIANGYPASVIDLLIKNGATLNFSDPRELQFISQYFTSCFIDSRLAQIMSFVLLRVEIADAAAIAILSIFNSILKTIIIQLSTRYDSQDYLYPVLDMLLDKVGSNFDQNILLEYVKKIPWRAFSKVVAKLDRITDIEIIKVALNISKRDKKEKIGKMEELLKKFDINFSGNIEKFNGVLSSVVSQPQSKSKLIALSLRFLSLLLQKIPPDKVDRSVLLQAIQSSSKEKVECLLKHGVRPDLGQLEEAIKVGNVGIFSCLLDYMYPLSGAAKPQQDLFVKVIAIGNIEMVRSLMDHQGVRDVDVLIAAIRTKNIAIVDCLNPQAMGITAEAAQRLFLEAIGVGSLEIVQSLLRNGFKPDRATLIGAIKTENLAIAILDCLLDVMYPTSEEAEKEGRVDDDLFLLAIQANTGSLKKVQSLLSHDFRAGSKVHLKAIREKKEDIAICLFRNNGGEVESLFMEAVKSGCKKLVLKLINGDYKLTKEIIDEAIKSQGKSSDHDDTIELIVKVIYEDKTDSWRDKLKEYDTQTYYNILRIVTNFRLEEDMSPPDHYQPLFVYLIDKGKINIEQFMELVREGDRGYKFVSSGNLIAKLREEIFVVFMDIAANLYPTESSFLTQILQSPKYRTEYLNKLALHVQPEKIGKHLQGLYTFEHFVRDIQYYESSSIDIDVFRRIIQFIEPQPTIQQLLSPISKLKSDTIPIYLNIVRNLFLGVISKNPGTELKLFCREILKVYKNYSENRAVVSSLQATYAEIFSHMRGDQSEVEGDILFAIWKETTSSEWDNIVKYLSLLKGTTPVSIGYNIFDALKRQLLSQGVKILKITFAGALYIIKTGEPGCELKTGWIARSKTVPVPDELKSDLLKFIHKIIHEQPAASRSQPLQVSSTLALNLTQDVAKLSANTKRQLCDALNIQPSVLPTAMVAEAGAPAPAASSSASTTVKPAQVEQEVRQQILRAMQEKDAKVILYLVDKLPGLLNETFPLSETRQSTPFITLVCLGDVAAVQVALQKYGANPNQGDNSNTVPLNRAILEAYKTGMQSKTGRGSESFLKIANLLLDSGAQVDGDDVREKIVKGETLFEKLDKTIMLVRSQRWDENIKKQWEDLLGRVEKIAGRKTSRVSAEVTTIPVPAPAAASRVVAAAGAQPTTPFSGNAGRDPRLFSQTKSDSLLAAASSATSAETTVSSEDIAPQYPIGRVQYRLAPQPRTEESSFSPQYLPDADIDDDQAAHHEINRGL